MTVVKNLDLTSRWDRLDAAIAEGRVLRGQWRGDSDDGGGSAELVCLLAQLSPEAGEAKDPSACPAEVMPPWLAELTPDIDDETSDEVWPDIVRRYADVTRRAVTVLDAAGWDRALYRSLAAIVREAASHTDEAGAREACDRVAALCDRVLGNPPCGDEWRAAAEAAAARAAARAAAAAAWAAKSAAESAAWEAAWAAAWAAAEAAAQAAVSAAARAEEFAAESAAWDRISHAVLDAIEAEVLAARGEGGG